MGIDFSLFFLLTLLLQPSQRHARGCKVRFLIIVESVKHDYSLLLEQSMIYMVHIHVQIMDKYRSNLNVLQNFSSYNFKIIARPVIWLKTSRRPPTSRRFGCHQKEIEPESEKKEMQNIGISFVHGSPGKMNTPKIAPFYPSVASRVINLLLIDCYLSIKVNMHFLQTFFWCSFPCL